MDMDIHSHIYVSEYVDVQSTYLKCPGGDDHLIMPTPNHTQALKNTWVCEALTLSK